MDTAVTGGKQAWIKRYLDENEGGSRMEEWKSRVYASYLSNGFKGAHSMRNEYELHRRYFKRNYRKYMPKDKNACILDLGCGMGQFLYFCQAEGYRNCVGVDASWENIAHIKKMGFLHAGGGAGKVYHASILEFLLDKKEHYDVIVLNDVMEHMTKEEIFKVMDAVGNALKRGGRFLAKTPNMANPFVACVGRYIDITHETGFTEVSMKQVLKAAGFCGITVAGTDIYVLNPIVSAAAKTASKMINILLYVMSALYGRTSIRIFEKDLLAVGFKE